MTMTARLVIDNVHLAKGENGEDNAILVASAKSGETITLPNSDGSTSKAPRIVSTLSNTGRVASIELFIESIGETHFRPGDEIQITAFPAS